MTLTFPWGARTTILLKPWTWDTLAQKTVSFSPCPFLFCLFLFPPMAGQRNHSPSSCTMGTLASHFFRFLRLPFQKVPGWGQSWGLRSEAVDFRCQNAPMYSQSVKATELAVGLLDGENTSGPVSLLWCESRGKTVLSQVYDPQTLLSALIREGSLSSRGQGVQTRGCTES